MTQGLYETLAYTWTRLLHFGLRISQTLLARIALGRVEIVYSGLLGQDLICRINEHNLSFSSKG